MSGFSPSSLYHNVVPAAAVYLVIAGAVVLAWYFGFVAYNRRQARRIMGWLEEALVGQGQILGIQWIRPSLFQAPLRLRTSVFQHPAVLVHIAPRELPFSWLAKWWRREPDTLIFEADFDYPPGFSLEVRNHRWCGRTARRFASPPERWSFEQTTPIVLTSRHHWEREVTNMMNALLSCREREFVRLSFSKRSPHFSATVSLQSISPDAGSGGNVFEMLRELAGGASAPR
ncbi:MAG: hypothetical protein JO187_13055 [Acidobacteria bacterium]|nr:hypothetical protein [Acidobacteriota bacterium]